MANNKPCERMYSTRYGCSKHPYYEGHNPHMRKHLCQRPITSYSLPSLSNLMPKSKTPSPKRPSSPVDLRTTSSRLGQSRSSGPNVPPPPPTTPQPGQPKLPAGQERSSIDEPVSSDTISGSQSTPNRSLCGDSRLSVVRP
jgi:hypothetical protein